MSESTTEIKEARERIRHANAEIAQSERLIRKREEEQKHVETSARQVTGEMSETSIAYNAGYIAGKSDQFVPMFVLMLLSLVAGVIIGKVM